MLELQTGDLIADRFRVEALLGEGGIARVYRVRHVRLGSVHAVKILTLPRPALADRLLLEGRIQAQLRHPNLVRVTDVIEHEDKPCLVMEYVAGTHLQLLLIERGALAVEPALELFAGVLSAVAAAHDQGVLHRDLKPANILLEETRQGLVPKVSDFGIAKVVASEGLREGQTRIGVQMGTPGYMAPEQVEDSAQVDHRADIFALGAILYEMLTGKRPFQEDTAFRTMQVTLSGRYPPLEAVVPGCPPHVVRAVATALAVPMDERFPDCHAFADALFAGSPQLRQRIERLHAAARPDPLRRPEITQATAPATPTPEPRAAQTLVAPDHSLPDGGASTARGVYTGVPDVGAIGVNTSGVDAPPSMLAAGLAIRNDAPSSARSLPTIAIDLDQDLEPTEEIARPARGRGPLPLVAAVLVLAAVGAGAWLWSGGDDGALPTEDLQAPDQALGERVEPPPAETAPPAAAPTSPAQAAEAPPTTTQAPPPVAEPAPAEREPEPPVEAVTAAPVAVAAPLQAPQVALQAAQDPEVEPEAAATAARPPAEDAGREDAARTAAPDPAAGRETPAARGDEAPDEAGDAVADAAPPEQATPRPPPALVGTWAGKANDNPLTIRITDQDGSRLVGELSFTQGAIQRVARVTGSVDPESQRLRLDEEGGAGLSFTGVVRGTFMMGTYGRQGKGGNLGWEATRQ